MVPLVPNKEGLMFHVLSCQFVYVYQFIRENWRHLKLVFIKLVMEFFFMHAFNSSIYLYFGSSTNMEIVIYDWQFTWNKLLRVKSLPKIQMRWSRPHVNTMCDYTQLKQVLILLWSNNCLPNYIKCNSIFLHR